jgi:hypothetical protein
MCCNLKHLQRCDTCYNAYIHYCYGYDNGLDCYENIFDKYFELEKKFNILQRNHKMKPKLLPCPFCGEKENIEHKE